MSKRSKGTHSLKGYTTQTDLSVYDYRNYRRFLRDILRAYRVRYGAKLADTVFLKQVGFTTEDYLRKILSGRQSLRPSRIPKFVRAMGLNENESDYFSHLITWNDSDDELLKAAAKRKVLSLHRRNQLTKVSSVDAKQLTWCHAVIRELIAHPAFQADASWIADQTDGLMSVRQAEAALAYLKKNNLIRKYKGHYRVTNKHLKLNYRLDTEDTKRLVEQALQTIANRVRTASAKESSNHVVMLNLDETAFQELRRKLREWLKTSLEAVETQEAATRLYQLNVHLNPVTQNGEENRDDESA